MKRFALLCTCAAIAVPFAVATVASDRRRSSADHDLDPGPGHQRIGRRGPGATVTVTDTRTGATTTITTDSQGLFAAPRPDDRRTLHGHRDAGGFQGQTVEAIHTTLQGPTQLTFACPPARVPSG